MSEKIFQSKKEVLEYLGKNPNDRRLVDRMIVRGEIEKTEDWYKLVQREAGSGLEERIKDQDKRIEELEEENKTLKDNVEFLHSCLDDRDKSIAIMEEENIKLKEKSERLEWKLGGTPNREPTTNMDRLREIAAGKFLSEPKEEKQQFVKGGDKREWNWNIMEYTWRIVTKKKIYKYSHENRHWYWVEDLCRYDKWRLVKLEHNDGEVYEDGIIDIDPEELSFYFEN